MCCALCSYVDEALRDLTGYPTQMLRLPHSLLKPRDSRLFAAQYGGVKDVEQRVQSNDPLTREEEEYARQALTVRLRSLHSQGAMLGCSHSCPGKKHVWVPDESAAPTEDAGEDQGHGRGHGVMRVMCQRAKDKRSRVEAVIAKGIRQRHACVLVAK